jgi:hypothetical protein
MKPKVLFIYDHKYPHLWKDGLWAAVKLLKRSFEVRMWNPTIDGPQLAPFSPDFILGWGGFGSQVDHLIQTIKSEQYQLWGAKSIPCGLCIGGNAIPYSGQDYDVLFYETEWVKDWLTNGRGGPGPKTHLIHAFGVNTDIYNYGDFCEDSPEIIWDYLSVGSFSTWKRQRLMLNKKGNRIVIGEIQKENYAESFDIIMDLLVGGVAVSDMVKPETLASIYRSSNCLYIPADVYGGGERAILEARACGTKIEIEGDNPKLKELLKCNVWDERYYARQLKKGIMECLKSRL